jgi:hypothetical protein
MIYARYNRLAFTFVVFIFVLLAASCNKDNGTNDSVSFGAGKYLGIYKVIMFWDEPIGNQVTIVDTMSFDFRTNGDFYMRHYPEVDEVADSHCEVNGYYYRRHDSLFIDSILILPTVTCNHDNVPEAGYKYSIDGDIIVFESRASTYRLIELWSRL